MIQSCEVSFNKKTKRKQERLQHVHNNQIFFSNLELKYRFISDRNDIGGMRFPLDGFSEMLIKFEYKSELPQFWIEKTYLTLMIVDIVQHQNELYHNFHIKDPWRGTTAAQIQNQPNNFIGEYLGNQIHCSYLVDIFASAFQCDMFISEYQKWDVKWDELVETERWPWIRKDSVFSKYWIEFDTILVNLKESRINWSNFVQ